jgi:predicted signal transduction protein with EAL and GGDEF domain
VVSRLAHCTRESDTISRQGGDEFILLLNEVPELETVERVAGEILSQLAEPAEINGHVLNASCSIGVAIYPEDGSDFDSLLQKADTAMYNAKDAGRNTYCFFDEQMNLQAHEHLLLQNRLHQALFRAEFNLHYQPQIEIGSGRVIGVEALLRWNNPELGDVVPARLIPVAEDCGLIVPIGAWVMEEACRRAQTWRKAGWPDLTMSVNLSALQFRRAGLIETVAGALERSGLPPHLLELELTESILLQDVENNLDTVRRLKALGVRLSIDDFGTGYSSLSYLKRFAVDRLKIDRSFVRDISTDPDDAAIVRAVIQLARSLRLGIIAEGVETQEQLTFLREEGCQEVQGFLFSRPLEPAAFENFLRERMAAAGDPARITC